VVLLAAGRSGDVGGDVSSGERWWLDENPLGSAGSRADAHIAIGAAPSTTD